MDSALCTSRSRPRSQILGSSARPNQRSWYTSYKRLGQNDGMTVRHSPANTSVPEQPTHLKTEYKASEPFVGSVVPSLPPYRYLQRYTLYGCGPYLLRLG